MRGILILICIASFAATCVITFSGPGDFVDTAQLASAHRPDTSFVLSATSVACAAFAPFRFEQLVAQHPLIHDIITDFKNPPAIVAAADEPRKNPMDYVGAEKAPQSKKTITETQREAFPEVRSVVVNANMAQVESIAREAIVDMGVQVIASGSEIETKAATNGIKASTTRENNH